MYFLIKIYEYIILQFYDNKTKWSIYIEKYKNRPNDMTVLELNNKKINKWSKCAEQQDIKVMEF